MNIFRIGSPPSSDRVTVNYIYDLEAKLTGVEYIITAAIASDAGTYECRASNKLNVVTKTIAVSVTSAAWVSDWQGMKLIVNILTLKIWLKVLPTFCNPFNFKQPFWLISFHILISGLLNKAVTLCGEVTLQAIQREISTAFASTKCQCWKNHHQTLPALINL